MSELAEQVRFDLLTLIEEDPVSFLFKGSEYRGASSGLTRSRILEVGGFEDQPEITIAINLKNKDGDTVFGQDRPEVGNQITIDGKTYRIDRTEIDSMQECLQMDLRSKNK